MLTVRLPSSVTGGRALQMLPLVLAAVAVAVMPAALLPVRPIHFDIPSTIGVGAAPEYSVAPVSRSPAPASTAVLPSESEPAATTSPAAEVDSGGVAPGAQRTLPKTGSTSDAWTDHLPRAGAVGELSGNLKIHATQPSPISTLLANIVKSLNRIHPSMVQSAKALAARMAMLKPLPKRAELALPTRAIPPKPSSAGWAVGGATPQRNILGGPAFYAPRYAPVINGASFSLNRER